MVARLEEKVSEVSQGDTEGQMVLAKLFSKADTFTSDAKGRIKIDERLVKHGGIGAEVVLVWCGSTFSIWNPEQFKIYVQRESPQDIASILKVLGHIPIMPHKVAHYLDLRRDGDFFPENLSNIRLFAVDRDPE
jgi:DNA-binding transcriptional regulator/RsmH inhibitor MraZ